MLTKEQELAAWESAIVQNLGPMLSDAQNAELWDLIVAHRTDGDVEAFAVEAREIVKSASPHARDVMDRAIALLPILTESADTAQE